MAPAKNTEEELLEEKKKNLNILQSIFKTTRVEPAKAKMFKYEYIWTSFDRNNSHGQAETDRKVYLIYVNVKAYQRHFVKSYRWSLSLSFVCRFRDVSALHYDPTRKDHEAFECKTKQPNVTDRYYIKPSLDLYSTFTCISLASFDASTLNVSSTFNTAKQQGERNARKPKKSQKYRKRFTSTSLRIWRTYSGHRKIKTIKTPQKQETRFCGMKRRKIKKMKRLTHKHMKTLRADFSSPSLGVTLLPKQPAKQVNRYIQFH